MSDPPLVPDRLSVGDAVGSAWSLPVCVLITGPDSPAHLSEKIAHARSGPWTTAPEPRS